MKWKIGNTTLDVLPPVKRYMNAIDRHLRVDRKTRARIMTELASDFQSRRENGQSDEAIMKELGTPEEVAAQFNSALNAPSVPSRWRWAFVVLAVLVLAVALVPMLADQFAANQAALHRCDRRCGRSYRHLCYHFPFPESDFCSSLAAGLCSRFLSANLA